MKIIKNFNQYLKEEVNFREDDDISDDDLDVDPDMDLEDRVPDYDDSGENDEFGAQIDGDDDDTEDHEYEYEEEVESQDDEEYVGTRLMKELADRLGVEVNENNEIDFDGKKINFFSETEKFHIGETQFDSVDDVISYLSGDDDGEVENDD